MDLQPLLDDVGDRHARAERAVGILEDDLHLAAERPHLLEARALDVACRGRRSCPRDEISRISARPSVVLPEPDSPTTPSVWPSRTATSTPSTALMWPTIVRRKPRLIGNQTLRSSRRHHDRRVEVGLGRVALRLGGEEMLACRGAAGGVKTSSVGPCSTIRPLVMTQTRFAILRTMPRSWVMNSIAMPVSRLQVARAASGSAPARSRRAPSSARRR